MDVQIDRISNVSWDYLKGLIPYEYMAYTKVNCINKERVTLYTAGEEAAALGYLLLTPCNCCGTRYEITHMQVVLEETEQGIGSKLIEHVIDDLKRNHIHQLGLSYEVTEDEESPELFFEANGFKKECTYSVFQYTVQHLLDSVVHSRTDQIRAKEHFKSYAELSRVNKNDLITNKNITINSDNERNMYFLVAKGEVVAMLGIYQMGNRIILDDTAAFDNSRLREIWLVIWSFFVEYVCETSKLNTYDMVEIVVPTTIHDEGPLKLIGEPTRKITKEKMVFDIN